VNAAFLLMSTAMAAGQEGPPPVAPAPAPVLVQPAPVVGGCANGAGNCPAGIAPGCQDPCPCEKKGLLARRRSKGDCDCTPPKRLFTGFTTAACDDGKGGLFGKLKGKFHKGDSAGPAAPRATAGRSAATHPTRRGGRSSPGRSLPAPARSRPRSRWRS
jgi:hypothetical protein